MDITFPVFFITPYQYYSEPQGSPGKKEDRKQRTFRPRADFKIFSNEEYLQMCRLSQEAIAELYLKLRGSINRHSRRSQAIPGPLKLIAVLHYLATGSFQHCIAARFGFTQPTMSRLIKQVVKAIVEVALDFIKFPTGQQQQIDNMAEFFQKAGFPNVLALIDCTHVAIIPPSDSELSFRNRKQFHSINVQVASGPWMEILDVVAKFPGSCHDSFILEHSQLGKEMSSGAFGNAVMLGDNGYPLKRWILTPYLNPQTPQELSYNSSHRKTRSQIERLFGLLKSRFRCLDISGGALLYSPEFVCKIIIACCVLHNIAIKHKIPITLADDLREHISCQGEGIGTSAREGQQVRNHITQRFFS